MTFCERMEQADFEFLILLPLPPECWHRRHTLPDPRESQVFAEHGGALGRQRQADLCELEASLVYITGPAT